MSQREYLPDDYDDVFDTDESDDEPPPDDAPSPDLGPCCSCRTTAGVRNIMMLPKRCPTPGRGWGCAACRLPSNGASVVLCDPCLKRIQAGEPVEQVCLDACAGWPGTDGRVPIAELTGEHRHDMRFHPEADPSDPG